MVTSEASRMPIKWEVSTSIPGRANDKALSQECCSIRSWTRESLGPPYNTWVGSVNTGENARADPGVPNMVESVANTAGLNIGVHGMDGIYTPSICVTSRKSLRTMFTSRVTFLPELCLIPIENGTGQENHEIFFEILFINYQKYCINFQKISFLNLKNAKNLFSLFLKVSKVYLII